MTSTANSVGTARSDVNKKPLPEGEAVAWRYRPKSATHGEWNYRSGPEMGEHDASFWEVQPLYAHPAPEPVEAGDCFECCAPLVGPFCPECNPAIKKALGYAVEEPVEGIREKVARIVAAGWFDEADGSLGLVLRYAPNKVALAKADAILALQSRTGGLSNGE